MTISNHPLPPPVIVWHQDPVRAGLDPAVVAQGVESLLEGCRLGQHPGAQLAVCRPEGLVLEAACGHDTQGRPLTPDTLMAWFSAGKPVTALGAGLLLDRGLVDLDDPVRRFIPEFGGGKEACTLRHLLTHTGGFPQALWREDAPWEEMVRQVCAAPAQYPPGTKAAYHPAAGWVILAELIQRVDGRPVDRFVREELLTPLAMDHTFMAIPPDLAAQWATQWATQWASQGASQGAGQISGQEDSRQKTSGSEASGSGTGRETSGKATAGMVLSGVVPGKSPKPAPLSARQTALLDSPEALVRVNPWSGLRGPARDLARFYQMILNRGRTEGGAAASGRALVDPRTVELFTACHRWGMADLTLGGAPAA